MLIINKQNKDGGFAMIIGCPKEIKNKEFRVGLMPSSVKELVANGHTVIVEKNLGAGIFISDDEYKNAGATVLETAKEVFEQADMIVKVKEPQLSEYEMFKENQVVFTYFHFAAEKEQIELAKKSKIIAIAYETITDNNGRLPLLAPMSAVAGRLSVHFASHYLLSFNNGKGLLTSGVAGTSRANIVILGAGVVGKNALSQAVGLGANVTILDVNVNQLDHLDEIYGSKITTLYSNKDNIEKAIKTADVVIGSVLIPGDKAPKLVSKEMLKLMPKNSIIVDVAIDQGGCFETSKPTTHENPIYVVDDIIHYCVANMPGATSYTSSQALNNATLKYVVALANKGYKKALQEDSGLLNGLNMKSGVCTHSAVASALGLAYNNPTDLLK